jgi:hypothetical protein
MKTPGSFLRGLGIGAIASLLVTTWARKGVPLISELASAKQVNHDIVEGCDQAANRLTSTIADFTARLSSWQELNERWAASLDEGQRSVAAELRRLRILIIWTLILSCFGVVAFTIVLFLAYIKF